MGIAHILENTQLVVQACYAGLLILLGVYLQINAQDLFGEKDYLEQRGQKILGILITPWGKTKL